MISPPEPSLGQRSTLQRAAAEPTAGGRPEARIDPEPHAQGELDILSVLTSVEETAYDWDMSTDRVQWGGNAVQILGVGEIGKIDTGTAFQFMIAPEHVARRTEAIRGDRTSRRPSAAFRLQYRFVPGGRRSTTSLWIEEHGHCWRNEQGEPVRARGVLRIINERYPEEQQLIYRSNHDELTGQLNRVRLTEALGEVINRAQRGGRSAAFLIAAVNSLAEVNETFGFDVGDEVLAAAGRIMRAKLRATDIVGRYSSNKFGLILNDCGPGAMRIAAERVMNAVRENAIRTSVAPVSATLSVAGVLLPDQGPSVRLAIGRALTALEQARARRQHAFLAYEASPGRERVRRRNVSIADQVTSALEGNRMRLVLQPIVSTATRQPVFHEALLRIQKPEGELVEASEFIQVAEQLGLTRLTDRRTLELAIGLLKAHPDLTLSVNVSSLTCSDHEWLVALHRLAGGQQALARRLIVEITETTAIQDLDQTVTFVDTVRELGCRVAIDDFGAGYTSFKNLKHLAADMVKIDGSFVRNLATDPSDRLFVKTLAELAHSFGLETVAEWVGDDATAEMIAKAGITYMQGFHFGRPFEVDMLRRHGLAAAQNT